MTHDIDHDKVQALLNAGDLTKLTDAEMQYAEELLSVMDELTATLISSALNGIDQILDQMGDYCDEWGENHAAIGRPPLHVITAVIVGVADGLYHGVYMDADSTDRDYKEIMDRMRERAFTAVYDVYESNRIARHEKTE